MYDWLPAALDSESSPLVSANLRLARTLKAAFGEQQIASGLQAWKTPAIYVWSHYLHVLFDSAADPDALPSRLNGQQCRVLWERCISEEVDAATTTNNPIHQGVVALCNTFLWRNAASIAWCPSALTRVAANTSTEK